MSVNWPALGFAIGVVAAILVFGYVISAIAVRSTAAALIICAVLLIGILYWAATQ